MMGHRDSDGQRDAVQTSKGRPPNRRTAHHSRIARGGVRASASHMGPRILATLENQIRLRRGQLALTLAFDGTLETPEPEGQHLRTPVDPPNRATFYPNSQKRTIS